ncbi:hypothetical protein [Cellulomonas sp. URHB0016]
MTQLLTAQRHGPPPVQRAIENATYAADMSAADRAAVDAFYNEFERLTREAYESVLAVPSLANALALSSNGTLPHWVRVWNQYLSGQVTGQMAAAFGYAVETIACEVLPQVAPAGCYLSYQVSTGGTRPDVVLRRTSDSKMLAWIDLTAQASAGHIFTKDSWHTKVASFAEITYPSLDAGTLAVMKANAANTGPISTTALAAQKAAADAAYRQKKEEWHGWGEQYTRRRNSEYLRNVPEYMRPWFVQEALKKDFGTEAPEDLVPSILRAMGVDPGPWGYTTGTTESMSAGDAWLDTHRRVTQSRAWVREWRDLYVPRPEPAGSGGGPIRRGADRSNRGKPY